MTGLAVVCGLAAEAKIASGPGNVVIAAGGDAKRLEAELDRASGLATGRLRSVISFGIAGGLKPGLAAGEIVVASAVVSPSGTVYPTDVLWTEAILSRLAKEGQRSHLLTLAGVGRPLAGVAEKADLHAATGASLVDMESHVAAAWAARHNVRFAVLRVITDAAERPLPHAATVGMRADGSIDLPAIFGSLGRDPRQVPALIRTGLDARAAFAALLRCRQSLGPGFAILDL